ncbi:MAG: hypothetical protein J6B48_09350 [Clostridia bacterium]|nr:hypothetical protein [Clostridia bacterium]
MKKSSSNIKKNSIKGTAAAPVKKIKNAESSPKLGAKNITLIVVSAILVVALIVGIIFICIDHAQTEADKDFDYVKSDITNYINIDKSIYKDYSVKLDIAKPKDIDVDVTLFNLLATKKGASKNSALAQYSGYIDAGDIAKIYYRGYTLDDDGNQIVFDTNLGQMNSSSKEYVPTSLVVGVGVNTGEDNYYSFPPGFDLNLAGAGSLTGQGRYFDSKNNFKRITSGAVNNGQIIYISYTRQLDGSTASSDKINRSAERIVLADGKEKIDAKYGDGFYDKLLSLTINSTDKATFTGTVSGKKYNYTDIKIDFATECENEETYILIKCYIPYDYSITTLRNKEAYYEVYVESIVEYEEKKLTNEFVEENLKDKNFGVTEEDLDKFEGDRVSQLKQHVKKLIDEDYEELYKQKLEEAMWNHYHEKTKNVAQYPKAKVDDVYNEYFNDVLEQFNNSGGAYTDPYFGTQETYETIDEYAVAYLGLTYSENKDWRAHLRSLAENLVKERLILFYILKEENLMPTAEELAARKKQVEDEYLEEYIYQYSAEYDIDKDTYSKEEWEKFEADRYKELHDYYDDDYFTEIAYYEIGLDSFLTWPKVTTLDGEVK